MSSRENQGGRRQEVDTPGTVVGFLASALKMEDQISRGVYEDYMNRRNWHVTSAATPSLLKRSST